MILVTGATGMVGGNLIWHLLQENDRVAAIYRPSSNLLPLHTIFSFYTSNPDEYLERIDWKIADVLNAESIIQAMKGVTIVYHCAAIVSFGDNLDNLLNTNVVGTRNVVRAALSNNIKKLCFVSSIAACGKSDVTKLIDENNIWIESANQSSYSKSKYYSEQEVWKGIKEGLNAVIINPGVILGVSGTNSGSSQLFSQVRKGLKFYTNGGSGYVDVNDVAKAMILLMKSEITGEKFILVGENCSNKDVLNWMADGFGKRRPFICLGANLLQTIGVLFEFLSKAFQFNPLIDRSSAHTLCNREYFSNQKIVSLTGFQFNPIKQCIQEVCDFQLKTESKI